MRKIFIILQLLVILTWNNPLRAADNLAITNFSINNFVNKNNLISFEVNFTTNQNFTDWEIFYHLNDANSVGAIPEANFIKHTAAVGAQKAPLEKITDREVKAKFNLNGPYFGAYLVAYVNNGEDEYLSAIYFVPNDGKSVELASKLTLDQIKATLAQPDSNQQVNPPNKDNQTNQPINPLATNNLDYNPAVAPYCTDQKISSNQWIAFVCSFYQANRLNEIGLPNYKSDIAQKYDDNYFVAYVLVSYYYKYPLGLLGLIYLIWILVKIRPGGVVFDSQTKQPVQGAIVRLFDWEKNKILATDVTDELGRYNFIIQKGRYYITVLKPQYQFPSQKITHGDIPGYYDIYHGEVLNIRSANINLTFNIPLDSQVVKNDFRRKVLKEFFNAILYYIIKIRYAILLAMIIIAYLGYLINSDSHNILTGVVSFVVIIEIFWIVYNLRIKKDYKKDPIQ